MDNYHTKNSCQLPTVNCQFNKEKYRSLCQCEESIPIYSRDWWLDTVCGESRWDVLLIEEKEQILATFPIYIPHNGVISMPPYTQTMGPWFAPQSADTKYTTALGKKQALCQLFLEELKKYPHFLQNFHYTITDWLPFYWKNYKQTTRYTYILENIENTQRIWEGMSSNIRRNITKAKEKNKITVRRGISIEEFLSIQTQSFQRQDMKAPHTETLKKLIQICKAKEQGDLWGGYDEKGNLHAAAFIVWQKSSAYYPAGGGNPGLRSSGAHSLVLWESICYASAYTSVFDFEGSMLPGVERFFREFGAKQMPFSTIYKGKMSLLYKAWLKIGNLFT